MPDYNMVPVDPQTFEKFKQLCVAYERKQGAQFRVMVENEWQKLASVKLLPKYNPDAEAKTFDG